MVKLVEWHLTKWWAMLLWSAVFNTETQRPRDTEAAGAVGWNHEIHEVHEKGLRR